MGCQHFTTLLSLLFRIRTVRLKIMWIESEEDGEAGENEDGDAGENEDVDSGENEDGEAGEDV